LEKALLEVEQRQADLEAVRVRVPIAGQILKIEIPRSGVRENSPIAGAMRFKKFSIV